MEVVERVAEAVVAQVRGVEDDAEPLHLAQQLAAARAEIAGRVGAVGVDAGPVVRRARPRAAPARRRVRDARA